VGTFIRKKKSKAGRAYFYLVENARRGPAGQTRQRVLAYLGRCATLERAMEDARERLRQRETKAESCRCGMATHLADYRHGLEFVERQRARWEGREPDASKWQADEIPATNRFAPDYARDRANAERHERAAARLRLRIEALSAHL
jgi:hypothetical protein